jgi:PAS domain S-box-containing protein
MPKFGKILSSVQELVNKFDGDFSMKTPTGKYLYVNDSFCKTIGKARAEIIGNTDEAIFPQETVRLIRSRENEIIQKDLSCLEYKINSEINGHIIDSVVLKCLIRDSSDKPFCFCVLADKSENKNLIHGLREEIERLFSDIDNPVKPE